MGNSLKDKVLESTDIVEVIGERVTLTRRGKEYIGLCPFHADHNPSLNVSPQKQIFKCWACGAGGDVIRFVKEYDRVDFRTALDMLARRAGIELRSLPQEQRAVELREEVQAAITWARQHFQQNLKSDAGQAAREYAARRGLNEETVERCGLGLAHDAWDHLLSAAQRARIRPEVLRFGGLVTTSENGRTYDRFRNRLIFPIADALGRPIAFGGRTLGDDPAKYLNSPETVVFSKSRVLYGFDLARSAIRERGAAIIVEGYLDAVLLQQHGFENSVATLGTALTDAHVKLLRPLAGTVFLCFDGDEAGARAADRGVEVALRTGLDVRVVLLEGGQDPADCVTSAGVAGMERALKGARDALEFKWSQTLSVFGRGGQQSKRGAIEELIRFVATIAVAGGVDAIQQNLLNDRLSALLGVPASEVFELLSRAKRAARRSTAAEAEAAADTSDYEVSVRGIPKSVVPLMETVFGHLLTSPDCWELVDEPTAQAAGLSETWGRLYRLLLDVHSEVGEYCMRDVMARCEDGALCELVGRARARIKGIPGADFGAARNRLASELGVLRWGQLRDDLRQRGDGSDETFRRLRDAARAEDSVLPRDSRCNLTPPA